MDTDSDTTSDPDRRDDSGAEPLVPAELRSVVVEYDQGPDQRTVYPDGATGLERMATWLTADADAFVDLESVR